MISDVLLTGNAPIHFIEVHVDLVIHFLLPVGMTRRSRAGARFICGWQNLFELPEGVRAILLLLRETRNAEAKAGEQKQAESGCGAGEESHE